MRRGAFLTAQQCRGSIIDLMRFGLEEEHALGRDLAVMQEEDLEEQMAVEDSTMSARREEEVDHRRVEDSFEALAKTSMTMPRHQSA
jgi:hypothetical protein